jgi:hypothetical protein
LLQREPAAARRRRGAMRACTGITDGWDDREWKREKLMIVIILINIIPAVKGGEARAASSRRPHP